MFVLHKRRPKDSFALSYLFQVWLYSWNNQELASSRQVFGSHLALAFSSIHQSEKLNGNDQKLVDSHGAKCL